MSFSVVRSKDEPIQVSPSLINDYTISIGARFLFIVIWSLHSEKFDVNEVSKIIKRNPSTTYKYLNELINSGYITRSKDGYQVIFEK
jgi:c-di-GMP-related signal transduction protein